MCLRSCHTAKCGAVPSVAVPAPPPPSATLSRRVPPLAHGGRFCRVSDKRHTVKWPLPLRLVAVEGLPWAAHGECLCHVLSGLRRVPLAQGKLGKSGSDIVVACDMMCSFRPYTYIKFESRPPQPHISHTLITIDLAVSVT